MRLFKEERQDLVAGSGSYKIIFLYILINSMSYPQVPINGFCKYNFFEIDSGYTSIFQLNFNNDAYSDLLLFNPENRNIVVLEGDINGTFPRQIQYTTSLPISGLESIINRQNMVTGYFFTSRKSLHAGIINFSARGKPSIEKEIKLNSYPEYISIKDYNQDNTPEYLLSGSAFNGISVIYGSNNKLSEKKAVSRGSYTKAIFTDISNDGFSDIAALNTITNSIDILYNNGAGSFYKVRSLPFGSTITCFKIHDIDLDGYDDILVSYKNNIKIFYGDYTSGFSSELELRTDYFAESFLTADYNKDGLIDIAYLDKNEGIISILFGGKSRIYLKEILYLKKGNIEKIIPFYSRFINGIIALSSSGTLYSITNLSSVSDNVNITAGVIPSVIKYFDYNDDGITDYAFMDEFDQKLKIITRNKEGIPAVYYSYPLFVNYNEFLIERISQKYKRFYCYSTGTKLIEIIDADLDNATFRRSSIYSPGKIFDIKVESDEERNSQLFIAFSSDGKLGITRVVKEELKYVFNTTMGISSNVLDAWFGKEKSSFVYYWRQQNSTMSLSGISYNRAFDDIKNFGTLKMEVNCSITGVTGNLLNNSEDHTVSFLNCGRKQFTISASDSVFLTLTNKKSDEPIIKNRKQLFCGEIRFNGLKKLLSYNSASEKIFNISFINYGKKLITTELIEAPGVRSFFIKNMSFRNYHLVYTNSIHNCITILQL